MAGVMPVAALALLAWLAPARLGAQNPAAGQQPPPKAPEKAQGPPSGAVEEAPYKIRTRVELVVVPVTVKNAAGQLVSDIRAPEFRIFEDEVEQALEVFSVDPFPISAVVLLDNALETSAAESLQMAAPSIAGGFAEGDEVAVLLFDLLTRPVIHFTPDNDALHSALKRMGVDSRFPGGVGSGPMTAGPRVNQTPAEPRVAPRTQAKGGFIKNIDDAVHTAAELLKDRGRDRRKIIFLVSDGMNSRNNTYSFDETLKLLLTADISVYAIGVGQAALGRVLNPLARYASRTGGDVFYASKRGSLESIFARVTEQARNQYTLAYAPRGTSRNADYHNIEVRVRRPGLNILTRQGYYRVPPP
jgi:VWFA-related protein